MFAFLEPALRFGAACEAAEVEYFLGGSAATTFHGEPRLTVAELLIEARSAAT